MITLQKIGDAIKFTFSGNTHYLQDGTIEVPVNSLSLTIDDSGMATFRKSASNDIFISATYGELGMTKDELVSWYKDNMVGGGGGSSDITSGEVQSMIDESISGKQDTLIAGENITISGNVISAEGGSDINVVQTTGTSTTDVMSQDAVTTKLKTKLDNVRVDPKTPTSNYSQLNLYLEKEGSGSQSLFTYVKTINGKSITSQNNDNLEGFSLIETSAITTSVTSGSTDSEIPTAKAVYDALGGGGGGTSYSAGTGIDITNDVISVTGKVDTSTYNTYTAATDTALSGKQDTLIAGSGITISGNVISSEGGNNVVELTQAEYDALVSGGTVDPTAFYIITDATPIDLSNYYTKSETSGASQISAALNAKQDTLVSGTNIKTINNESILGSGNINIQGGGKAVSAGTNISITTGETADTINCTLPITADTKHNYHFMQSFNTSGNQNVTFGTNNNIDANGSFIVGGSNYVYGNGCFVYGYSNEPKKLRNGLFGDKLKSTNSYEFSFGQYNNSVSASTTWGDSGNTLFSVGNGTAENARHNAFEIRQNGDIYLTKDGQDVKLQDQLGGGGTSYSAGTGIDITNDVISVTGKVDTSAITTSVTSSSTDAQVPSAKAVYDQLGGLKLVKLTQSEYDALETKDSNTLYFIGDTTNGYTMKIGSVNVN